MRIAMQHDAQDEQQRALQEAGGEGERERPRHAGSHVTGRAGRFTPRNPS